MMEDMRSSEHTLKGKDRRYISGHDACMRLMSTIVMFENDPVMIVDSHDGTEIVGCLLRKPETLLLVDANDSRLDISSIPMGYLNIGDDAVYPLRGPIRSQKQGIDIERVSFYSLARKSYRIFSADHTFLKSFDLMVKGIYPSFEQVLEKGSGAISRVWALGPGSGEKTKDSPLLFYHRSSPVGVFSRRQKTLSLQKECQSPWFHRGVQNMLKGDVNVEYCAF